MRKLIVLLAMAASLPGWAQGTYPASVMRLVDRETPLMSEAVRSKDRAYFSAALQRVQQFTATADPLEMEWYPACTQAVTDFLIAGLCRISPPGTLCEPTTFLPRAENYMAQCRSQVQPIADTCEPAHGAALKSIRELPAEVQTALGRGRQDGAGIADIGEQFNRTDVILDETLPQNHLAGGRMGQDCIRLYVEHGGIGLFREELAFQRTDQGWTPVGRHDTRKAPPAPALPLSGLPPR